MRYQQLLAEEEVPEYKQPLLPSQTIVDGGNLATPMW